jgi:acyl carrier protein
MSVELFESIRLFTADELSVDLDRIALETSLFHDLGVDGADGWEFVEAFGERFGVNVAPFRASLHFGPEAGPNPFVWLWWIATRSWPRMVPITFADLTESARAGIWQTPTHPPRPAI